MSYAYFGGCKIPYYLKHYETATRAVLHHLDIRLNDMEFNCCGYPVRHRDETASIFSAARNLALAARTRNDILTPCQCCFGHLKYARFRLQKDASLRQMANRHLAAEGLEWRPDVDVHHLLSVLFHDVTAGAIAERVRRPLDGLKIAAHYGCHALRPGHITGFDNPLAPTLFETLVNATGAESIAWSKRLECCGNPLWGKNDPLALHLMTQKIDNAFEAGADAICTACTHCQIQFESVRRGQPRQQKPEDTRPAILYIHLLGWSLGLTEPELGWDKTDRIRQLMMSASHHPPLTRSEEAVS